MESLRNKYKGETAWIVGKGPSLQHLTAFDFGPGPVITLNQAIVHVEALGLSNPIYSMQKDGGAYRKKQADNLCPDCDRSGNCGDVCGDMVRPKEAALLLHDLESRYCFPDYTPRHVLSWGDFGLSGNSFSLMMAVETARAMGSTAIRFLCFDAHMTGDVRTFIPGKGVDGEGRNYRGQVQQIQAFTEGLDCKWTMPGPKPLPPQRPWISFGVMCNDPLRLDMCLKQSQLPKSIKCHVLNNPESATKGLNILLSLCETDGADVAVLAHQDMYFRAGWIAQAKSQIKKLPDSWIVAGIIGKAPDGLICGKFHDMRIPLDFNTEDLHHTFPHPATCFDEAAIIVNLKKGFRFDEVLTGFDLYGTLCVLQAWEMGGTAWVIDAYAEHYCMRSFSWHPDQLFIDNYKMLHDRYSARWTVDSTALSMSGDPVERANQKKAFMVSAS